MATYLTPDKITTLNGVKIKEYLLTKHNPNKISMPTQNLPAKILGITIHNTDWISVNSATTPAEQYTRATVNGNAKTVRVHYYVDNTCAWQNLPLTLSGWHAADGSGDGNRKTISIECIMDGKNTEYSKKSRENAARLIAYLLDKYNLKISDLYTHTYWLHKCKHSGYGVTGTHDYMCTHSHPYKTCLPMNDTELLTPYGWKSLNDITKSDKVMQFNPATETLSFTDIIEIVEPYKEDVISYKGIEATPNHRMLIKFEDGYQTIQWGELLDNLLNLNAYGNTKLDFTSVSDNFNDVQADILQIAKNTDEDTEETKHRITTVSCVTVETGYILIRQNNIVMIVGNCPQYIIPDWENFKKQVESFRKANTSDNKSSDNKTTTWPATPFIFRVTADKVGIHVNPDTKSKATGVITTKGSYTITELSGNYGKLKSGKGWIYLKDNGKVVKQTSK